MEQEQIKKAVEDYLREREKINNHICEPCHKMHFPAYCTLPHYPTPYQHPNIYPNDYPPQFPGQPPTTYC